MKRTISIIIIIFLLNSCYSFRGASIPEHLKTINIDQVIDQSGYGYPLYRDELNQGLIRTFRNDNSLRLLENEADANLKVKISRISDEPVALQQGELESERKITVTVNADYYDNVLQKEIFSNQSFSQYQIYDISNPQINRDEAVLNILNLISNDILLAIISGW